MPVEHSPRHSPSPSASEQARLQRSHDSDDSPVETVQYFSYEGKTIVVPPFFQTSLTQTSLEVIAAIDRPTERTNAPECRVVGWQREYVDTLDNREQVIIHVCENEERSVIENTFPKEALAWYVSKVLEFKVDARMALKTLACLIWEHHEVKRRDEAIEAWEILKTKAKEKEKQDAAKIASLEQQLAEARREKTPDTQTLVPGVVANEIQSQPHARSMSISTMGEAQRQAPMAVNVQRNLAATYNFTLPTVVPEFRRLPALNAESTSQPQADVTRPPPVQPVREPQDQPRAFRPYVTAQAEEPPLTSEQRLMAMMASMMQMQQEMFTNRQPNAVTVVNRTLHEPDAQILPFKGNMVDDPIVWCNKLERIAQLQGSTPEAVFACCTHRLLATAKSWYKHTGILLENDWPVFRTAFCERFQPSHDEGFWKGRLDDCTQNAGEPLARYFERRLVIVKQNLRLLEFADQRFYLLQGLKNENEKLVLVGHCCRSLADVMEKAIALDQSNESIRKAVREGYKREYERDARDDGDEYQRKSDKSGHKPFKRPFEKPKTFVEKRTDDTSSRKRPSTYDKDFKHGFKVVTEGTKWPLQSEPYAKDEQCRFCRKPNHKVNACFALRNKVQKPKEKATNYYIDCQHDDAASDEDGCVGCEDCIREECCWVEAEVETDSD